MNFVKETTGDKNRSWVNSDIVDAIKGQLAGVKETEEGD